MENGCAEEHVKGMLPAYTAQLYSRLRNLAAKGVALQAHFGTWGLSR